VHQVPKSAVQLLKDAAGGSLDLASVQFRSDRSYQVVKVAEPDSLKVDDAVYMAGFPVSNVKGFDAHLAGFYTYPVATPYFSSQS
jgi:hypothetical protein